VLCSSPLAEAHSGRRNQIHIDGETYDHDVVIDRGEIKKWKKKPSKKFRDKFGHTPLSIEEKIPWNCRQLFIGTGVEGRASSAMTVFYQWTT